MLKQLEAIIRERKANPTPDSYTAQLLAAGEDKIVQKVGEEAVEVIIAAKGQGRERLISECADLAYHLTVLLVAQDLSWADIEAELARRHTVS